MKRIAAIILLITVLLGFSSCNVDKYLQNDQRILRNNSIDITMADSTSVTSEIRSALSNASQYYIQKPNKKILFIPFNRILYCIPTPEDSSFWGKLWHKAGKPPVIYDSRDAYKTAAQLNTLLKTKGSFNSIVKVDTSHRGKSYVDVTYRVIASHRYTIDEVRYRCLQQDINDLLQQWKADSYLKAGDYYDQDLMTLEQQRIVDLLKSQGYYHATKEMVHFLVDTTYIPMKMGILLSVRIPQNAEGKEGNNVLHKYYIGDIYIYPNVSTALSPLNYQFDTLLYQYRHLRGLSDLYFIHTDKITPSPKAISRSLFVFPGMPYRPQISSNTSNSLLGLHNFKYVDISFVESPRSSDTLKLLDTRIRLLNSSRHRVSLSFELTNSSDLGTSSGHGNIITSGNLGLGTSVGYENSNLFGDAERFNLSGGLTFDFPKKVFSSKATTFYDIFSNFEGDVTASLDLPSFLAPFAAELVWQSFKPHTLVQLSYNYLFRSLSVPVTDPFGATTATDIQLERVRLGESFGYSWNQGRKIHHVLLPLNLSYSRLISGEEYYRHLSELTHDRQFLYQTRDFVLLNTHYEFTYTDQDLSKRGNFSYYHFSVETAGNVLNGIANLIGKSHSVNSNGKRIEFSQYFRFESEYKKYFYLGQNNTLVLRLLGGFALPYGKSAEVPYEKMFTGGGPTSMRGWSLRHLGPGQRNPDSANYIWGVAPIQLVFNIEERFPLFGIFEGAVFADLGNVWEWQSWGVNTRHNSSRQVQNYKFEPLEILKGFALDAGLGLRAKISVITLRLDLALPIYDPNYGPDQRWFNTHWAWNILALNFGINYPF